MVTSEAQSEALIIDGLITPVNTTTATSTMSTATATTTDYNVILQKELSFFSGNLNA